MSSGSLPKHCSGRVKARWHSSRNSAETRKYIFTAKYSTKPPARVGSSLLLGSLTIPKGRPAASQDTSLEPNTNTSPQNAAAFGERTLRVCPQPGSEWNSGLGFQFFGQSGPFGSVGLGLDQGLDQVWTRSGPVGVAREKLFLNCSSVALWKLPSITL